ncbi:MAG: methionine synthase, partial [bacterium]
MREHHVDVVGSFLRPETLLEARSEYADGAIKSSEFKSIEDQAVRDVVGLQEDLGFPVVTDGEMRRESFQSNVTDSIRGFGDVDRDAFLWGDWHSAEHGDVSVERPGSLGLTQKLEQDSPLFLEEFVTLRSLTNQIAKLTVPSPGLFLNFWSETSSVYKNVETYMDDLIEIYRSEIDRLVEAGLKYLQLDAPHY